jgi:uncharacterized membrane protein YbhN (UPF0104 family)
MKAETRAAEETPGVVVPDGLPRKTPGWRAAAFILKGAVTVAVLWYLAGRADWTGFGTKLAAAEPDWLLGALTAKFLSVGLASERWRQSVAAAGGRIGMVASLRTTTVGLFFGQALPGAIGGDIARGWLTYRVTGSAAMTVIAFMIDRLLALAACLLLVLVGLSHLDGTVFRIALASIGGLILIGLAFLYVGRLTARLPKALRRYEQELGRLRQATASPAARIGFLQAVAVHLCTLAAAYACARALHLPLGLSAMFAVVPAAILASALPVSINGWGPREGAFVAGLAQFGVGPAEAIAISVTLGLMDLLTAVPGAIVFVVSKERPLRQDVIARS